MRGALRLLLVLPILIVLAVTTAGCSTVYPLKSVAYRTTDPRSLEQDVSVDISARDSDGLKKLAWVAYSATFECSKDCPYSLEERRSLAREVAETSFRSFDRELRRALGAGRELAETSAIATRPEFSLELKTDSYKKTVSRWFDRFGLARAPEVVAMAGHLKNVDPGELGWSGAGSVAALGKALAVDGVLVGHVRVTVSEDADQPKRLVIQGPRLWVFSSSPAPNSNGAAVAVVGLKPAWRLDPAAPADPLAASAVSKLDAERELKADSKLDWRGFDAVAGGMSDRVARALDL